MTDASGSITVRQARRDDISAILAWANAPAFLAATRAVRFSEAQLTDARISVQTMIDHEECLIAVHDNIRIAAIVRSSNTVDDNNVCPVWYVPRLQFDWVSRMNEVLNEAKKVTLSNWKSGYLLPEAAPLVSESIHSLGEEAVKFQAAGRRVLVLGPAERNRIPIAALRGNGYKVNLGSHHDDVYTNSPYDLIVCNGYHLRIPQSICDQFSGKIINIHVGCLPWGRGIGPLLFGPLLNYPLGTSIHLIDTGLDTGDIILESRMDFQPDDTLRSIYPRVLEAANQLFVRFVDQLVSGCATRVPQKQVNPRAFARTRTEFETVLEVLPNGYDTQFRDIAVLATAMKGIGAFRNHLAAGAGQNVNQ